MVAALATALIVGMPPCMAADSTGVPAADDTAVVATTGMVQATGVSVADAVAEAIDNTDATGAAKVADLTSERLTSDPTPDTPGDSTHRAGSPGATSSGDFWHDVAAQRGQTVRIEYEGDRTFEQLKVQIPSPFQSFRTRVADDQSITVFVPHYFTGASKVSPVFTVSDGDTEIDTFSVSVEYPRPKNDPDERTSPLFRLISDIAFRLPQLPFVGQLLAH